MSGGEQRVRRWTVGRGWVSLMSGIAVVGPGRTRTRVLRGAGDTLRPRVSWEGGVILGLVSMQR